jgi:hypothetical protein
MRKSLIVSAVIAVSTLFAGIASADEGRGVERPTVQNLKAGRNTDAAERTAQKIREFNDRSSSRPVAASKVAERKIEKSRPRGDMVDAKGPATRAPERTTRANTKASAAGERIVQSRTRPRGDVDKSNGNGNGNRRVFTIANDRRNRNDHGGPRTIVDVMKRREVLSFISGLGVKVNCSQTGTCVEETTM